MKDNLVIKKAQELEQMKATIEAKVVVKDFDEKVIVYEGTKEQFTKIFQYLN